MQVLAGTAEVDQVVTTARQLATAGLGSEGARLAGQAAIRATHRKGMTVLLECARAAGGGGASGPAAPGAARGRDAGGGAAPRERSRPPASRSAPGSRRSPAGCLPG